MNIFICDNDPIVVKQIQSLLVTYFKNHSYPTPAYYTYTSGEELLNSGIKPDIVYLDIEMPGCDGISVGRSLRDRYRDVLIIIVTSYIEYLDDAMRINVFRYLDKPINQYRFSRNLDDAIRQLYDSEYNMIVNSAGISHVIPCASVMMIETNSAKHMTYIHTIDKTYQTADSMQHWSDILKKDSRFYKCNRSYIINMMYVSRFDKNSIILTYKDAPKSKELSAVITMRKYSEFRKVYLIFEESMALNKKTDTIKQEDK